MADPKDAQGIAGATAAPGSPNIITVFIDDMGWSDLSCFGGAAVKTQHIDRLASEGIRFTRFYVNSPICSPSRVALTTGQYPHRRRITSFLNNRRNNTERGVAQWLDPAAPVLARELQQAGYATGHFGKWHMGGQRDVADAPPPADYGFDRSLVNFEGMGAKLLPLTLKPGDRQPGRIWQDAVRLGEPVTWMQRSRITSSYVAAALEFIGRAQAAGKPFFVNVWPDDVHSPFFPPVERWGDNKRALYQAVLDAMDEQLAPLFDRLRNDAELRANTLVIFCSDNGPEPGAGSSDPLRGAKTWLYEGGIRSPLIVWGPGLLARDVAGATNDESVLAAIDLNRSLYAVTGTPLPGGHALDGEDVSAALLGKSKQGRKAPLFFRRPPDRPGNDRTWGMGDNPDLAALDGKWKFLVNYDHSQPQLYDLAADPAESNNLIDRLPEVAGRLEAAVFQWNSTLPADAGDPAFTAEPLVIPQVKAAPVAPVMPRAEIEAGLRSHDRALFIKQGWIRDPYIVLGPDDRYYLTGTTPPPQDPREQSDPYNVGLGPQSIVGTAVQVWRSKDLIDWEYLGTPFTLKDSPHPRPGDRIWAPEIHWVPAVKRWALVHCPKQGSNLALSAGAEPRGPWTFPMGRGFAGHHDPSLFRDGDTWWVLSENTFVQPLAADFSRFTGPKSRIDPAGSRPGPAGTPISRIGHEGATMMKVGTRYVHLGTAWSTDRGRKGSYNLYYCTADKITGPYGPRRFAGRFLGHGTPFQTRDGNWWCTAFFNANVPPLPREGIATRDLSSEAQTINPRGTTIVPLDVRVLPDGDIHLRAKDPAYASPGPDEAQKFD